MFGRILLRAESNLETRNVRLRSKRYFAVLQQPDLPKMTLQQFSMQIILSLGAL